jgi:autoinducer 2-binding protein LuxP
MRLLKKCVLFFGTLMTFHAVGATTPDATSQPDANNSNYWQPEQLNDPATVSAFQNTISGEAVPSDLTLDAPVKIALIYPSADVSDFWIRNFKAMTGRLKDLNIPFEVEEFSSKQIEHSRQTRYTDVVLERADQFDFVVFGPSELQVQAENIQRLSASDQFETYIWAFHTPMKSWTHRPDAWFDFSSSVGAKALCEFMTKRLGEDVFFAMNRGIPGITDDQRSGEFNQCVQENAYWINLYEHFGQYQPRGGRDGVELILKNFPEVQVLHNANTAMTIGAIEYLEETGQTDKLYVTGWGGTAIETQKIKDGSLNATPMRMSDDVGVATAEAIKYTLLKREAEIPQVYLGRIRVIDDQLSDDQIDALTREAFRYSGIE